MHEYDGVGRPSAPYQRAENGRVPEPRQVNSFMEGPYTCTLSQASGAFVVSFLRGTPDGETETMPRATVRIDALAARAYRRRMKPPPVPNEPREFLAALVTIVPDFGPYWDSDKNLFRDGPGDYSFHGIYARFSHYFREHLAALSADQLATLFTLVEASVRSAVPDLSGAATTCFLENIAGEGFTDTIAPLMGAESRHYYALWD